MKVLFLLTQSLDYPSGLGRYGPIAGELVRLGHRVRIAALHPTLSAARDRTFVWDGVTVHYAGPMHVRQAGHERSYYGPAGLLWAAGRGAWGLLIESLAADADAIHVCKPHPMNGLAGVLGTRLRGRRLYLDCDDYEATSNRFGSAWQQRVVAWWEDRLPRLARGITTNTRFTQERLGSLGVPAGRILYVPNGIDRRRFAGQASDAGAALRAQLGLGGVPVVSYVGSLSSASHPLGLLLEAFALLRRTQPGARLLIAGGGEDYGAVRDRAARMGLARCVLLAGRVEPEQVPAYYSAGDLTVDPVLDDPTARARSPLKLFESMACGVPVVTGDVGDRREHLGDGRAGLLVAPGSAEALAQGMAALLESPDLRRDMGRSGRELAERYYWDVQIRQFARVYDL